MDNSREFEQKIGFEFKNRDFLLEALTHRSYLNENPSWPLTHNERLEFLGDAVLELVITENLFRSYPDMDEGKLTNIRAALVNYQALAKIAARVDMDKYLFMSKGEMKDTGKAREVILANACEALLGAMYLDRGYDAVAYFIVERIFSLAEEVISSNSYKDAKSFFQEKAQERAKVTPTYAVLQETGPDHKKIFVVGVFLKDKKIAEGKGTSKQEAELDAAKNGLEIFEKN